MEKLKHHLWEFWNYALLVYRTVVIKAESKKRRLISHTEDWNKKRSQANIFCANGHGHLSGCPKVAPPQTNVIISDGSSSGAPAAPPAAAPEPATPRAVDSYCDRSEMKRVFDLFDENKDGLISAEELQLYMRRLGTELSDQNVRDMVGAVDRNGDDYVDFEEFLTLYTPPGPDQVSGGGGGEGSSAAHGSKTAGGEDDHEEALLRAFFVFDENKDGLITVLELQQVLLKLGLPEGKSLMGCQKMIERVDSDGNGKVDFFEFKEMMSSDAFTSCKCS